MTLVRHPLPKSGSGKNVRSWGAFLSGVLLFVCPTVKAQDEPTSVKELSESLRQAEAVIQELRQEMAELRKAGAASSPPQETDPEALRREIQAFMEQAKEKEKKEGLFEGKDIKLKLGGQYRVVGNASNFGWHPLTLSPDQDVQSFANQRFRTWLAVIPNETVEGYIQMEVGHILWGENFEWTKSYGGPRFPASTDPHGDRVGIELRRGYLTYKNKALGNFRVGIQDWQDAFGEDYWRDSSRAVDDYNSFGAVLANSIWDFNVGGVLWQRRFPSLADLALQAGWFVLWEGNTTKGDDAHLFTFDADLLIKQKHGIGFSSYFLYDGDHYSYPTLGDYENAFDAWLGLRGKTQLGPVPLNAFVILNPGRRNNIGMSDFTHFGWAAKVEAGGYKLGPGKLFGQLLYSSGDSNPDDNRSGEFRTIAQSERDNLGAQGYWSYLALTSPHGPSDVNDLGVGLQNRGLGLFTIQSKYEYPIVKRFSGAAAVGALWSAEKNPVGASRYMGTELATTLSLDLTGGLSLDFGAAALFTGDFYRKSPVAGHPDTLWELFARMQLEF